MKNQEYIHSEFVRIKDYFGLSINKMCELSEMNYNTFCNCYRGKSRNYFTEKNLRKLKVNLNKLMKNFDL